MKTIIAEKPSVARGIAQIKVIAQLFHESDKNIVATDAVLEEAGKIAPEDLLIQGISAEELKDFNDAYLAYKTVSADPREANIERSGYTKQIANLFIETTKLKKKRLDRLATQFKREDPDFYQKYQAPSIIFYRRSSKKSTNSNAATDTKS